MSSVKRDLQGTDCLILSTADNIGGMERVICSLARQLVAAHWPIRVVFPQTPKAQPLLEWCRAQHVPAEVSSALVDAAAPHSLRTTLALNSFVRHLAPQTINIHYGDNFISLKDVLAIRLAGRHRCVVTVHHPTSWTRSNERKRLLTRLAAQFAHRVIAVSHATRDILLEAGVPPHKVEVIYSGLAAPGQIPCRADARARLALSPDDFVIGTLARLEPHKGIHDLIEATARTHDPQGKLCLLVGGDGPERERLEQLAKTRLPGRVRFLGRIPSTQDLYSAADIFVLPSYLEGFGLVYVEAAFHGVPSIGTTVGGVPEAIRDGETGLLIAPGNVNELATAIARLQTDPALRMRLGQTARQRAMSEFRDTTMAEKYRKALAA
jgi:glycosyltransferase involved in cell wall biosynthesis